MGQNGQACVIEGVADDVTDDCAKGVLDSCIDGVTDGVIDGVLDSFIVGSGKVLLDGVVDDDFVCVSVVTVVIIEFRSDSLILCMSFKCLTRLCRF